MLLCWSALLLSGRSRPWTSRRCPSYRGVFPLFIPHHAGDGVCTQMGGGVAGRNLCHSAELFSFLSPSFNPAFAGKALALADQDCSSPNWCAISGSRKPLVTVDGRGFIELAHRAADVRSAGRTLGRDSHRGLSA